MALTKIGASIVLEGEKSYRQALKEISAEQKVLKSEMQLTSATYKENQNSIDALSSKYDTLSKQLESQKNKVSVYASALDNARNKQQESAEEVEKYSKELDIARAELEKMKNSEDSTNEAIAEQEKLVSELEGKLAGSEAQYNKNTASVQNWQAGLNIAQAQLVDVENELSNTEKYLDEAKKSTDGTAKSINEYGEEVNKASAQTTTFGEVLKANLASEVIIEGVKKLCDGVERLANATVSVGASFEYNMSQVAATMGITVDEIENGSESFEKLKMAAEEAGATTMFSASEAAEALNYLALAGYDADKAVETLPKVLSLASAGGLDLATASDMVTDSMAALGLETSELDKYIDEMAKTSQKSNTSVRQLVEATLAVAGTISSTGQSLEVMNAELGVLANNGIKGAEGGTHLRNVLLALASPTDKASATLQKLNINIMNSDGTMRDLNSIMIDLNKSLDGLGDVQRTEIISTIFNKTDLTAVNALLKSTNGEFDSLYGELKRASGAANEMANTLNNNLKGKVAILQSSIQALEITMYDLFDDALKDSVDSASGAVSRLNDELSNGKLGDSVGKLADSFADFVDTMIDWGTDALPVVIDGLTLIFDNMDKIIPLAEGLVAGLIAFKTTGVAINVATTAMSLYKTVVEGATVSQGLLNVAMKANPAALVATGVGVLTTAISAFAIGSKKSKSEMEKFNEELKKQLDPYEKANKAALEAIETRKKEKDSFANSKTIAEGLVTELQALSSQSSLTAHEQTRLAQVVDELNAIYPDLNLAIDEHTGKLNLSNAELEKNIELLQEQYMLEAAQEDLKDIATELYESEKRLNELYEQQNEALIANQEAYAKVAELGVGDGREEKLNQTAKAAIAINEQIEKEIELQEKLNAEYQGTTNYIKEYNGELDKTKESINSQVAAVENWHGHALPLTKEVHDQLTELSNAYDTAKEKAIESLDKQIGLFEELSNKSDLSVKQMKDHLDSQTEVMNTYREDMITAMQLVEDGLMDEGLLGSIKEMGIDGAGYLHELVEASKTDMDEFNAVMQAFADQEAAKEELANTLADIETNFSETKESILESASDMSTGIDENLVGIVDSIIEKGKDIIKNATSVSDNAVGSAKDAFGIGMDGKSKQGMDIGASFVGSMTDSILESEGSLLEAVERVTQSAINKARERMADINRELGELM